MADIPLRIKVGVTGHRIIPEPLLLAQSVRSILVGRIFELFDGRVSRAGRSTSLSYTLLTSLAEGADQLVAAEITTFPGSELEAVLPLAQEDYQQDFLTPESKAEFQTWLAKARKTVALRPSDAETRQPEVRNMAYENAGRFVVDHCDLMIALWDGKPSRDRGGTAEIVAYARKKRKPLVIISTLDPKAILVEKGDGLSSRALNRLVHFNRFPILAKTAESYAANLDRQFFQNPEGQRMPEEVKSRIRSRLLPWYVRASLIARHNQKRHFRAGLAVYVLSPLAVAAVGLGVLVPGWSLAAFLVEFFFLTAISAIVLIADRRKVHKKWIEMRFLTERIRSAVFLSACGKTPADLSLSPLTRTALYDDEWTLGLFDEIMRHAGPPARRQEETFNECVDFIRIRWVGEQIAFHTSRAGRSGRISRFLERAGQAAFLAAIMAAAWHIAPQLFGYKGLLAWLERPAVFLAVVLPAIGAAIGGVRTHREYSRLERTSRFMKAALFELDRRYADVVDFKGLEALLQETEQVMLQETHDWLMLMKSAKMEAI
jgi:hypothetical protein